MHALLGEEVLTTPEVEERLREDLGLNDPLPVQYINWLTDALRGDLGQSIQTIRMPQSCGDG